MNAFTRSLAVIFAACVFAPASLPGKDEIVKQVGDFFDSQSKAIK